MTDAAFNFLLVWYYCTLTIRESILINNGSRWARAGPGLAWPGSWGWGTGLPGEGEPGPMRSRQGAGVLLSSHLGPTPSLSTNPGA